MAVHEIVNVRKEKVGEIELNDALFGVEVNPHLLHDVVRNQLANRRAGNACTKTRVEVSGSTKKPYKQKGTGRARAGNRRSPLWRGGGVSFGPKPRSYEYTLPRKVRRLGLCMALSARRLENSLVILDEFQMEAIRTKNFVSVLEALGVDNALFVIPGRDEKLEKSSRNVPGVKVMPTEGVNVFDVLKHKNLVLLQKSIEQLEKRLLS